MRVIVFPRRDATDHRLRKRRGAHHIFGIALDASMGRILSKAMLLT